MPESVELDDDPWREHRQLIKQVFEETGVRATFESLLTVRVQHGAAFGASARTAPQQHARNRSPTSCCYPRLTPLVRNALRGSCNLLTYIVWGVGTGRDDFYYVAAMKPATPNEEISIDGREISECAWLPFEECACLL